MKSEEKIITMLEQIMATLDQNTATLNNHSKILNEHSGILNEHSEILKKHSKILNEHSEILEKHSQKHDHHTATLNEHGQILSALRIGQEHLQAEVEGIKLSSAKQFDSINEHIDEFTAQIEVLQNESWEHKTNIQRIKTTMGMG